jgi:hypothetical protein
MIPRNNADTKVSLFFHHPVLLLLLAIVVSKKISSSSKSVSCRPLSLSSLFVFSY